MTTADEILSKGQNAGVFAITPSDTEDLSPIPDLIWVGAAANLTVMNAAGDTVLITSASGLIPVPGIMRVMATGTAATALVGIASGGFR